jgi:2-phospho-L-lactate/phosphoenolpyruvate guanylyltransferase
MSSPPTYAIVPVKALALAKRRLAPVLPDEVRRRLVLAMLEDVLTAIAGVREIEGVVVVTPDAGAARVAADRGATILPEPAGGGLNAAVESAIAYAMSRGLPRVVVLPADIPLATPQELASLIASRPSTPGVTLAPSHDGNGTNALLLAPPDDIAPCYGPGSYLQHMSQAMARHIDVNVLHLAGVGRDIDEPRDLSALSAAAPTRYGFLAPHLEAAGQAAGRAASAEEQ